MTRADTQGIDDMLQAMSEIADIVSRGRVAFDHDIALRRAVERCLEILGESRPAATRGNGPRAPVKSYRQRTVR